MGTQPLTRALIIVESKKDSPFEAGDRRKVRSQDGKGETRRAGGARFNLSGRGGEDCPEDRKRGRIEGAASEGESDASASSTHSGPRLDAARAGDDDLPGAG